MMKNDWLPQIIVSCEWTLSYNWTLSEERGYKEYKAKRAYMAGERCQLAE